MLALVHLDIIRQMHQQTLVFIIYIPIEEKQLVSFTVL